MTLFEYLAVAVSIVIALAAARLMNALPHILARDRRYWIHATIACVCLAQLGNSWWVLWSFHAIPEWTSASFFLVLGISGLHSLALLWIALISLQNWVLLGLSWQHPARVAELLGTGMMAAGAASSNPRLHALIAVSMALASAVIIFGMYSNPAALALAGG